MYTCVCVGHEIRKETMKEEEEVEKTGETRESTAVSMCAGKQGDRIREGKCVKMPQ